jgi:hypothetical protein
MIHGYNNQEKQGYSTYRNGTAGDTEEQNGGYGQHGKTVSIKHCFTVPIDTKNYCSGGMENRGYSRHRKPFMSALRIMSIDIDNLALKVRSCMVQRSLKSYVRFNGHRKGDVHK